VKHAIEIERDFDVMQNYEKNDENLITAWIIGPGGERFVDPSYRIEIFLSRDGMIGLGTELIRKAYGFKPGRHWHLEPMIRDNVVQRMGVYVLPSSNEMIICCDDLGKVEDYLKKE